jgi:hypothetical protein
MNYFGNIMLESWKGNLILKAERNILNTKNYGKAAHENVLVISRGC